MPRFGLWRVQGDDLHRVEVAAVDKEAMLEGWIERDPSLLQAGLAIVGRQVSVEGNRLDLLGLDFRGAWVVIEIKRDALHRDTSAQALDYASLISSPPAAQLRRLADDYLTTRDHMLAALLEKRHATLEDHDRDVSIVVVGTGRDAALDCVAIPHLPRDFYEYLKS
jgi:Endonuclease NucS C-terminal domain